MRFFTRVNALSLILFAITPLGRTQDNSDRAVGAQPPSKANISNIDPKTLLPQDIEPSAGCERCTPSITFRTRKAANFQVGTQIPTLPFKTKQSWAGNIAIPDTPTTKGASLFFWLWGKDAAQAGNDLVIWMNGGPGCNSLIGMCTENGPFIFENDKAQPNPYSWTTAANILYIAQPVGASFTTGFSSNSNEMQISQQLTLFLIEFFKVFPELASFNIWLTGESYVGQFAGFQWNAIKNNPLTQKFALKGGMLVSPLLSDAYTQVEVAVSTFVEQNKKALKISKKGLASIKTESKKCKLASFLRKYVAYPTKGRLPAVSTTCDPFAKYVKSTVDKDPTFNIYNIKIPLVQSTNQPSAVEIFFNTASVQSYIHAPKQKFQVCKDVFVDGNVDKSESVDRYPTYKHSFLAQMFEESERFIIMTGMLDGLLFSQGVQLALQNLTWAGVQGFIKEPTEAFYDM